MKEPLDVSNATSEVFHARVHAVEAAFYRYESFLCCRSSVIALRRCQAANEMMFLGVLTGAAHEFRYAVRITCVTNEEVI
jgi:hypothetical protein